MGRLGGEPRDGAEADELVSLYRATAGHLSRIRTGAPDPELIAEVSARVAAARTHAAGLGLLVTATLAASDPDLRRLLTTGTTSATQISNLIQKNGGDIGKVVGQLSEVARTIEPAGYMTNGTFAMLSALLKPGGGGAGAAPAAAQWEHPGRERG